jgi:hypothetical protein
MVDHRPPVDAAPEADAIEQQHPVDTDEVLAEPAPATTEQEAAEADVVEQARPVPGGEDYPHGELDAE